MTHFPHWETSVGGRKEMKQFYFSPPVTIVAALNLSMKYNWSTCKMFPVSELHCFVTSLSSFLSRIIFFKNHFSTVVLTLRIWPSKQRGRIGGFYCITYTNVWDVICKNSLLLVLWVQSCLSWVRKQFPVNLMRTYLSHRIRLNSSLSE